MNPRHHAVRWLLLTGLSWILGGCQVPAPSTASTPGTATAPRPRTSEHVGESLIFIGEEPARLAYRPNRPADLRLRSTYEVGPTTVQYQAGRDYLLDPALGTLRRTPGSRIPDFRTNVLYGRDDFDHSRFPGFGNHGFFAYADYAFHRDEPWPSRDAAVRQRGTLPKTLARLSRGEPLRLVAFGDSITAGGDATRPGLIYWQLWADSLRSKGSQVEALNGATGGDTTANGLQRLQAKVLDQHPDLVIVAFGMNDHNRGGIPIPQFKANLQEILRRIRTEAGAEVILVSAFPPNPRWHFGQGRMEAYATATGEVAAEAGVAYADVYQNWQALAARKKCEDLLGNDINHPNDFGHWIYFRVLEDLVETLRAPPTP